MSIHLKRHRTLRPRQPNTNQKLHPLLFHRHVLSLVALASLTSIPLGSRINAVAERARLRSSC